MKTTSLLDLPTEIRSAIWEHCRPNAIDVMACANHGQQLMPSGWDMVTLSAALKTSPLLLVNKSIHHDTRHTFKPSINLSFACHFCMTRFFRGATDKQLSFISTISISKCRVLPPGAPSIAYSHSVLMQKRWREERDRLSNFFHGRVSTVENGVRVSCVSDKNWVRRWKVQVNHRKDIPERPREQALHLYLYLLVPYFDTRYRQ